MFNKALKEKRIKLAAKEPTDGIQIQEPTPKILERAYPCKGKEIVVARKPILLDNIHPKDPQYEDMMNVVWDNLRENRLAKEGPEG